MKRALSLLPLCLLAAVPAQAQMVSITPEQIGQIFCIGSLANDMAPVEALLTPDLTASIEVALARNSTIQAERPDEKPPLGDGLPWRTWPDYADGCTVGAISVDAGSASVVIDYSFAQYPQSDYSNKLMLEPVKVDPQRDPAWRIDDIDLGEGNTLRTAIVAAFEP